VPHRLVTPTCRRHTKADSGQIANLPDDSLPQMVDVTPPGIYFGYAQISARRSDDQVDGPSSGTLDEEQTMVYPMAMSLGWNRFYKNEKLTAVRHHFRSCRSDVTPNRLSLTGNPYHASLQRRLLRTRDEGHCARIHSPGIGLHIKRYVPALCA